MAKAKEMTNYQAQLDAEFEERWWTCGHHSACYDEQGKIRPEWEYPYKTWTMAQRSILHPNGQARNPVSGNFGKNTDDVLNQVGLELQKQQEIVEWRKRDEQWLKDFGYTYTDAMYRKAKTPSPTEIRRRTEEAIRMGEDLSELPYIDEDVVEELL